jgi:hypothetical protein
MRAFASVYASNEPCQSRWSGATFSSTDTRGWRLCSNLSWNDEASTTRASNGSRAAIENG